MAVVMLGELEATLTHLRKIFVIRILEALKHYVATTGSSSVVKHFLNKAAGTDIKFNQTIETISLTEDGKRLFMT